MPTVTDTRHFAHRRVALVDLEYVYSILALLMLTGALDGIFNILAGADRETENNPIRILAGMLIYSISLLLVIRRPKMPATLLVKNSLLFAVLLLPLVSTVWSADAALTLKRAAAHSVTVVFCLYIASRYSIEELFRRLNIVFFIGAVASIVFIVAFPSLGIHHGGALDGSLKGIYGHKAELGRISVIAIIVTMFTVPLTRGQWVIKMSTLGMFILFVIFSQSRTNWAILCGVLCLIPMLTLLRMRRFSIGLRVAPFVVSGLGLIALVYFGWDFLLAAMGRDDSFSGRTTLWEGVISIKAKMYPYLGAGYGAFFSQNGAWKAMYDFMGAWRLIPNHAHSGYLNTWADLGYPGVIVLGLVIVSHGYRVVLCLTREPDRLAWRALACYLLFFLVNNFAASEAFTHSDISWAFLIMSYCYTSKALFLTPSDSTATLQQRVPKAA